MQCTLDLALVTLIPGEELLSYKAELLGLCSSNPGQFVTLSEWGELVFHFVPGRGDENCR